MIKRRYTSRLLLGFGALLAVAFAAACGSAEEGVTREELRTVVQEAVAGVAPAPAPAGPSAAEISGLVSAAVAAAAPAGVSSADVAAAVEAAVAAAAGEALTAADIQALVGKAVEEAVSGGPTPLSSSEVQAIVSAAVGALPTPEPLEAVVEKIVERLVIAAPPAAATPVPAQVAPAAPLGGVPMGQITYVLGNSGLGVGTPSGWPTDCLWCHSLVMAGAQESILSIQRTLDGGIGIGPWLAASWETASDFSFTEFKLNRGVMFHQGFGELTTDDIVYTYEAADPQFTTEARHDTLPNPNLDGVEAIDDFTIRYHWGAFAGDTLFGFTDFSEGVGIFPREAFDEMGEEWMRQNPVGTGPYQVDEWTEQKGMFLSAAPGRHWRQTPSVETIRLLEIPEATIRVAMLETGEADMGSVPLKDWQRLLDIGYTVAPETTKNVHHIVFSGNHWTANDLDTGEPLGRQIVDKPWIGNPFADGDFSLNTESMLNAQKVRLALSMSIDREAFNDVFLLGVGEVAFLPGAPVDDPIFVANADRWSWPLDIAGAKQLLTEAGYPDGFKLDSWWVGPSGLAVEMAEAIAAEWLTNFNIDTVFDRQVYSTMRPTLVERTQTNLQMRTCCNQPSLWPIEWIFSAPVPTGYNHGLEIPLLGQNYKVKIGETDQAKLEELTLSTYNFLREWALLPGIIQEPVGVLYNTNIIDSWDMRPFSQARLDGIKGLATITLK